MVLVGLVALTIVWSTSVSGIKAIFIGPLSIALPLTAHAHQVGKGKGIWQLCIDNSHWPTVIFSSESCGANENSCRDILINFFNCTYYLFALYLIT